MSLLSVFLCVCVQQQQQLASGSQNQNVVRERSEEGNTQSDIHLDPRASERFKKER